MWEASSVYEGNKTVRMCSKSKRKRWSVWLGCPVVESCRGRERASSLLLSSRSKQSTTSSPTLRLWLGLGAGCKPDSTLFGKHECITASVWRFYFPTYPP